MARISIKSKMTWAVVSLITALMVALGIGGYRYFAHEFKETIAQQQYALASMAAEQLDDQLEHAQKVLQTFARNIRPEMLANPAGLQRYFEGEEDVRDLFDGGLLVLDPSGRLVAETPYFPARLGISYTDHPFVRDTLKDARPQISTPYRAPTDGHSPTITLTAPLFDRDKRVVGLLAGHFDLLKGSNALADLRKIPVGKSGYLYLFDRNRVLIVHRDMQRFMEPVPKGLNVGMERAIAGFDGSLENVNSRGVAGITSFKHLSRANWIVASHIPLSEAYAPLHRARFFFAVAVVLVLGISFAFVWLIMSRLTAPLSTLTDHVRQLPGLTADERFIRLQSGDELEDLSLAFNTMVKEIDFQQQALQDSQSLYRIIAEFTGELALLRNPDGTIRYISPNCLTLTGYEDQEFYLRSDLLDHIVHPDDRERWQGHRDNLGADGKCPAFDLRLVTKAGTVRWFNHVCQSVLGSDGEFLGVRASFRDNTARMELEQEVSRERAFAMSLLENTSTPLFVVDASHRIIVWNRACAELTGFSAEEMLGSDNQWQPFYPEKRPTLCDLVVDGKADQLIDFYQTFTPDLEMSGIARAEGWYRDLNGKNRYLHFNAAPVYAPDGKLQAVVETLHDITERKEAEETLRLFSQAIDQSASSIVITDKQGVIQYVNRQFCEITGYSREEAVGQNPRVIKSGQQPQELYDELWQTITSGKAWHGELHNRRKDGSFFWEMATISPIVDKSGNITQFLAVKEDISSRKEAERKLRKQQAELLVKHEQLAAMFKHVELAKREWEQTMDCIGDMVVLIDADRRVRRCNRAFAEFTGLALPQLAAAEWDQLCAQIDLDLTELGEGSGELFHEPSGRWFTLNRYDYIKSGGSVITLHDLTEVKRVTQELNKAYEEMKATHMQLLQQEKMASIGQLAAGVAHEINNPMGFISSNLGTMGKYVQRLEGFIGTQAEALAATAPAEIRAQVDDARKKLKVDYVLEDVRNLLAESCDGAERVRTIVQNLKSFSRVDEAQRKESDLNECLESTITIAWNELKYKTTLVRDYGELPPVSCYPQQLNQVFLNLLVNAAHAIEKQGEITVKTWQENNYACVSISDTGGGIPEEIKNRIFEPFFTTKEVGKGTGLGLSISYDIVKKHNGIIEVASTVGQGTTFTVRLPLGGE